MTPPGTTPGHATISALLQRAEQQLHAAGIEHARREARLLVGHALQRDPLALLRDKAEIVRTDKVDALLARRAAREPFAFLTGAQGFWSLELEVSNDTLIPRADTETLVEAALNVTANQPEGRVLDLGTGTGCLLLSFLSERPGWSGAGVDISSGAAQLAQRNAHRHGLADRAAFLAGHWADALAGTFDLVLSNPPYIPSADIEGLMPEVVRFEPLRALDGGPDGLEAYRVILDRLPTLVAPNGMAIMELGIGQDADMEHLAKNRFHVTYCPDLAGIARAALLRPLRDNN